MKATLLIIIAAITALAAGVLVRYNSLPETESTTPVAGLDFSFPDSHGQLQSITQWRGKILIINFWATWCPPCLKEIPEFVQLQQTYQDRNLQFIGIAIEEQQPVAEYLEHTKLNYPILVAGDAGSSLSRQLGNIIGAVPFTVIVNPQGQIIHRHPGELSKNTLLQLIQPLLTQK